MKKTLIRFAIALSAISFALYFFTKSSKKTVAASDNPVVAEMPTTAAKQADSAAIGLKFKEFEQWLSAMHLQKPNKCYKAFLDKLYLVSLGTTEDAKDFAQKLLEMDKETFEFFIKEGITVLTTKDKLLMIGSKKYYTYAAVFNKADSLIAFDAIMLGANVHTSYSNPRLEDWNKDGSLELVVGHSYERSRYNLESNSGGVEIYDFNSFDNKIIPIFDYTISSYSATSRDVSRDLPIANNTESKISFENPNLIKLIERQWFDLGEIKESEYKDEKELYQTTVKEQQEYIKTHPKDTTIVEYYQRDNISKKYVKKQ